MSGPASSFAARLISIVIPPACGICGKTCALADRLCRGCAGELQRAPTVGPYFLPGLDRAFAALEHAGTARKLVAAAKYRERPGLLAAAAGQIADRLRPGLLAGRELVPVPAEPWRRRRRGFDPAAELAGHLAQLTGLPVRQLLARSPGAPQAGRPRAVRLERPPQIRARSAPADRVTLVDDVATTGATLAAAAEAARAAGARSVDAVTFTRAPVPGSRL